MSDLIGLFMVWLGGALCGVIYSFIWIAQSFERKLAAREKDGYYTKADIDALWEQLKDVGFEDAGRRHRPNHIQSE